MKYLTERETMITNVPCPCWNWNIETRKSFSQHHLNALLGFKLFNVLSQFLMTLQILIWNGKSPPPPPPLPSNSYHDTTMGRICCRSGEIFHHRNPAVGYVLPLLPHTPTNIPLDPSFTSATISLIYYHYHYYSLSPVSVPAGENNMII